MQLFSDVKAYMIHSYDHPCRNHAFQSREQTTHQIAFFQDALWPTMAVHTHSSEFLAACILYGCLGCKFDPKSESSLTLFEGSNEKFDLFLSAGT